MPKEYWNGSGRSASDGMVGLSELSLRCPKCRRGVFCYYPTVVQHQRIQVEQVLEWVRTNYPDCPERPQRDSLTEPRNHPSWGSIEIRAAAFVVWEPVPAGRKPKTSVA